MKKTKARRGFTIIEVSLVLAIAGIILTMAFIALPALQRQTRDAQRKEDTTKFVTALKKYQQNNRGALPKYEFDDYWGYDEDNWVYKGIWEFHGGYAENATWGKFYNEYLGKDFTNPEGDKYSFGVLDCRVQAAASTNVCAPPQSPYSRVVSTDFKDRLMDWYIYIGATCENGTPVKSNNNRNAAVVVKLETNDTYCVNT